MLKWLWRRRRVDDDTRAEFESHLDLLIDRYVRFGMTPDEARTNALRQFGNVTWHREEIHLMNGVPWIDGLSQDFRYGLRQRRHSLGFSGVVVATLALGIGGTTAVFSVLNAVLLAPLPYAQPGQLVRIYQQEPEKPGTRRAMSAPQFRMLRAEAASFADVGARLVRDDLELDISTGGDPSAAAGPDGDERLLPRAPRRAIPWPGFRVEDETAPMERESYHGAARVVLSDAVWRARFSGDPSVVGTTIHLSAEPYEIAGIAPAGFEDPVVGAADAWLPYDLEGDTFPENNSLVVFGRLRTGVRVERASSELAVLSQSASSAGPKPEPALSSRCRCRETFPRPRATCRSCSSLPSDSSCWSRA